MGFIGKYIKEIAGAVKSLLTGMKLTGYYATHHGKEKITQQYPDNLDTLNLPERFRGHVQTAVSQHHVKRLAFASVTDRFEDRCQRLHAGSA